MKPKTILATGAVFAAAAVALGAFGAHALKQTLIASGRTDAFDTAVRYQFYHSFALLISGVLLSRADNPMIRRASGCWIAGILLFSGSLYALSFVPLGILGIVTPVGGLFLLTGWALFIIAFVAKK